MVALAGMYVRSLSREELAKLLGHIEGAVAQTAETQLGAIPVDKLQDKAGMVYDMFVPKLPLYVRMFLAKFYPREKVEDLAEKVWMNFLKSNSLAHSTK